MTVADAAQSLKLGPRQVEALEAEDWLSLPGNTMIRGFVRNYARLLSLDPDELMRELDAAHLQRTVELDVSAGTTATLPPTVRRVERRDYLAISAGLILLVLAGLAYYYVPADFWQSQMATWIGSRSAPPAPVVPPVRAPGEVVAPKGAAGESVTVLTAPNATVLSEAPAARSPAGASPATAGGLKLGFAQPAWAEVRDGRGQIVFSGVSPAGSRRDVAGQPPFSLVLGNATQVSVEYQGKVVDLAPHINGDVARLTVE